TAAFAAASSRTSSLTGFTRSPYCATRGASSSVRRAPATTLFPAASAASAMSLPNPFPLPVINQTLDMKILLCFLDRLWAHFQFISPLCAEKVLSVCRAQLLGLHVRS